ncbi:MAG: phosphoribosylanthranilate isomerase [Thermoleophilaceae bacterium]
MKPPARTRFKICCIQGPQEADLAVEAGACAVGLVSRMPSGPGVIPDERIADIAARVPPGVDTFLLTSLTDAEAIVEQHRLARTSALQLVDRLPRGDLTVLRETLPGVRLIQVIHVLDEGAITAAEEVSGLVDAILLDSGDPSLETKELGGTGRRHDWAVSARVRERVEVPMFLAGGLDAANVAEAIETVRPFAVDVCSGLRDSDESFDLDPDKLARFAAALQRV